MMLPEFQHNSIVTFYLTSSFVVVTLLCYFGIISPLSCYYSLPLILRGEFWRLYTNLFFLGGSLDLDLIFHLTFFISYSNSLETTIFRDKRADFVYMLLFFGIMLNLVAPLTDALMMSSAFTHTIIYVWSKHNAQTVMSLFGVITFRAPYLPYIFLVLTYLFGGSLASDMSGIVIGHLYYYFKFVLPDLTDLNIQLLKTPWILTYFVESLPHVIISYINGVRPNTGISEHVMQRNMQLAAQLRASGLASHAAGHQTQNDSNSNDVNALHSGGNDHHSVDDHDHDQIQTENVYNSIEHGGDHSYRHTNNNMNDTIHHSVDGHISDDDSYNPVYRQQITPSPSLSSPSSPPPYTSSSTTTTTTATTGSPSHPTPYTANTITPDLLSDSAYIDSDDDDNDEHEFSTLRQRILYSKQSSTSSHPPYQSPIPSQHYDDSDSPDINDDRPIATGHQYHVQS